MHPRYVAAVADLRAKLEQYRKEFEAYTLALAKAKTDEANYLNCVRAPENLRYTMFNGQRNLLSNNCKRQTGEGVSDLTWRVELAKRLFDNLKDTVNNLNMFPPRGYKIQDCSGTHLGDLFLYHPKCEEYRASNTPAAIKAKTLADRAKFDADFPWAINTDKDPFKASRVSPKAVKPKVKTIKNKLARPKGTTTFAKKPISKLKK